MTGKHVTLRRLAVFIAVHTALAGCVFLFGAYLDFTSTSFGKFLASCPMHDLLRVYCPTCGATRAVTALLRFDLLTALRCHTALTVIVIGAVTSDICLLISILRKKEKLITPRPVVLWSALGLFLGYFILRDVLLICFSVDITGDFIKPL